MSATDYSKAKMGQEDAWRSQGGRLILDPDDPFTVLFFAPYGELSDPINEAGKRFREKILPRAFSPSLGKGMVACFYEHNPDRVLGIEGVNMTIAEAEDGLRCRVQLEPTTFNMALIDSVSANELQASVGMSVLRDRWPKSDERHVVSAILREISLVHTGAYPQTSSCFSRPPGKERSLP